MLIIRLSQTGKRGERKFRVVVKERRSRLDGKPLEYLGWYEKTEKGVKKDLNMERITYWQSVGARISPTVAKLLSV